MNVSVRLLRWIVVVLVVTTGVSRAVSQQSEVETPASIEVENNAIREEVQRYFGYEDLFPRYLTLPYDLNQNVNQKGKHVDFGFTFLAILPLMFLALAYRKKKVFYPLSALFVVYLGLCFHYGHIVDSGYSTVAPGTTQWDVLSESGRLSNVGPAVYAVQQTGMLISTPIFRLMDSISQQQDGWTYPVLFVSFLVMLFWIVRQMPLQESLRSFGVIGFSFSMLWLLIGGGIIWYAFFSLVFGFSILGYATGRLKTLSNIRSAPVLRFLSITALTTWVVLAFVARVSSVDLLAKDNRNQGTAMLDRTLYYYAAGLVTDKKEFSGGPNARQALDVINADNRTVYQVGTHLVYDIKNNHYRVFEDNGLAYFGELLRNFPTQASLTDRLKAGGVGYLLVDLNTPGMDKTPEQSLIKKYQYLLAVLKENPGMRLLATDRVVETSRNGAIVQTNAVFGEKIVNFGNYAIYEVI
ncbi:MAG: hypothetical protein AAFQ02_09300 [Bacteroidota bacterium]